MIQVVRSWRARACNRHQAQFVVDDPEPVPQVRLAGIPDGGLARLLVLGELMPKGLAAVPGRWLDTSYG